MSLGYQRVSKEEDQMRNVIEKGIYNAIIEDVKLENTKPGKDKFGEAKPIRRMLVMDLLVIDNNNRDRKLKDWIMLEGDFSWKFRHLAVACGLEKEYDEDRLELFQLLSKRPNIKLGVRDGQNQFGEIVKQNYIADYVPPSAESRPPANDFKDDEIPF